MVGNGTPDKELKMSEILIEAADHGREIEVKEGDIVVIRLEETLSTGYSWEVGDIDESVLELIDSDYSEPDRKHFVGGGGARTFRFKAGSAGQDKIRLRLRRSWDPEDEASDRFEISVRVN